MAYKIYLTTSARKEIQHLEKDIRSRIADVIDVLTTHPLRGVKKLKTPFHGYRVRIGNYRILFVISGKCITVYSVAHRKDAYR